MAVSLPPLVAVTANPATKPNNKEFELRARELLLLGSGDTACPVADLARAAIAAATAAVAAAAAEDDDDDANEAWSAGPGPPSEPNAWLCAERVEGACEWEARAQERWSSLGGQWRAVGTGRRWWGGESGRR
ncbi:hypothetical protein V8E52_011833 [Russula decolorans]